MDIQYSPLLPQQQGILFDAFLSESHQSIYLIQLLFHFKQPITFNKMVNSWTALIRRHEIFRASIQKINNEMRLCIHLDFYDCTPQKIDLMDVPRAEQKTILRHILEEDIHTPFHFEHYPLMRWIWIQIADEECYLVWTVHHSLIGIANSGVMLINELFTIYDTLGKRETYALPYPIPYTVVVDKILSMDINSGKQYWQQLFHGFEKITPLPFFKLKKSSLPIHSQRYVSFSIDNDTYEAAADFIKKHQITFNTLFQATWGILLSKYSGELDVTFGTIRAFPRNEIGYCTGLFINALPIRIVFSKHMSKDRYLMSIREQQNSIRKYVHTPLYKIRQWCQLTHLTVLFNTLIDFKPTSLNQLIKVHNKNFSNTDIQFTVNTNYGLVLELTDETSYFSGRLHYKVSLFSENEIKQLINHVKLIFKSLINPSKNALASFDILTPDEKQKLLFYWNNTSTDYSKEITIIKLFEDQVRRRPQNVALQLNNECMTYEALNKKVNQLANFLLANQKHRDETKKFIGIILERSFDMVIAILGILKAGFAYIPIHPRWPMERINFICHDASIDLIIVKRCYLPLMKDSFSTLNIIVIEDVLNKSDKDSNPNIMINPQQMAYAIYTSGTTRRPKGVLVSHRAILNTILNHIAYLKPTTESYVLHFSSPTFDVAIAEWATALTSGSRLCIAPSNGCIDDKLFELIQRYNITVAILPASIVDRLPLKSIPKLEVLVIGGELCRQKAIDFWSHNRRLINAYGLTETAICSTMCTNDTIKVDSRNIGKPLPNVKVYILDNHHNLLPIGAVGEICISGTSLASGYLNESNLTQETFIKNPINSNEIICKTGDYGRWREDGHLEYLFRRDTQMKIRGYRINLLEINETLCMHPLIKTSVTLIHQNKETMIVAYVVLKKQGENFDTNVFRKFVKGQLPEYMIPALFIAAKEIPLTQNGKIDEVKLGQMLEEYFITEKQQDNTLRKTNETIRSSIIDVWKLLLSKSDIDANKNFFDLGAYSFMLIQAAEILTKKIGVSIDVMDFFNYPTVNQLTQYISIKINMDSSSL